MVRITGCVFTRQDATKLKTVISNNSGIKELILLNSKMHVDQLLSILSCKSQLKHLNLSECQIPSKEIKQILNVLKQMKHLLHVDLSGNNMTNNVANDIADMIIHNKNIQKLILPDCALHQSSLRIIIRAMQTVSLLQYVDLNINTIDNELASEISLLVTNNNQLKELRVSQIIINQTGLQHLHNCVFNIIKGLKVVSITGCIFTEQDESNTVSQSNFEKLNSSSCEKHIDKLLCILSYNIECKWLDLSNCQLQSNDVKQIFSILKKMKYLQHVNLRGNVMTDNVANDIADMIINNKNIQILKLPDCILNQMSVRIIIQAMQTVSSLKYIDLNVNTIDDEVANDIAFLVTNNSKLKFAEITLTQSGFLHLKNHVSKIKGLQVVRITGCHFTRQDATKLKTLICNNSGIKRLNLSSCTMHIDQLLSILSFNTKLIWLDLSKCHFHCNEIIQILSILKQMKHLQHVDLHTNVISSDAINELAAMIKNNKQIQAINLSDCILNKDLKIIFEAMRSVSSLQYIDFSTNKVNNELASDVAAFCTNNCDLKQLKVGEIKLNQNGFEYLKTFLIKFHRIKYFSITDCNFMDQDADNLAIAISNNMNIQELDLSNCTIFYKIEIFKQLSVTSLLQSLKLNNITITDQVEDEVVTVINNNSNLEHLEMAGCNMSIILYIKLINSPQFKNISKLNFSYNSVVSKGIKQLLPILSSHTNLKSINLSNCQLKPNEISQIFRILKKMSYLQCVDLSQNTMIDNVADDIADMIINNKDILELVLTDCVVNQTSLRIIIQAMKTISSSQFVDFSTNKINDKLACTTAILAANCNKLEQLKFAKLQSSFQHQKTFLVKSEGIKHFSIIDCTFDDQNATVLEILVDSNHNIEELFISNYRNNATDNIGKFVKLNVEI